MLFVRSLGNERRLCVVNYSDHQVLFLPPVRLSPPSPPPPPSLSPSSYFNLQKGWGTIILPDAEEGGEDGGQKANDNNKNTIEVVDLMTGEMYDRVASELRSTGLHVGVNTWQGAIFRY